MLSNMKTSREDKANSSVDGGARERDDDDDPGQDRERSLVHHSVVQATTILEMAQRC